MAYLSGFSDAGDPLVFNSTKYPGTCKPSNKSTLDVFRELQRQLNRVAQLRGLGKIAVDGDIGPGTVSLANKALGAPANCTTIAASADGYANQAKIMADNGGAPATVASPVPIRPSTIVNAVTGVEVIAPRAGIGGSVVDAWKNLTPVGKVAGLAIAGGLGYYLYKRMR